MKFCDLFKLKKIENFDFSEANVLIKFGKKTYHNAETYHVLFLQNGILSGYIEQANGNTSDFSLDVDHASHLIKRIKIELDDHVCIIKVFEP